jgi:hypothetical protein
VKRTQVFLFVWCFLGLVWEALAIAGVFGPHATISDAVWSAEAGRPFVAFLVGLLAGHLVWQRKE